MRTASTSNDRTTRVLIGGLVLLAAFHTIDRADAVPVEPMYVFEPNTPIRADEVNANFTTIYDAVNSIAAVPTGTILPFAGPEPPPGYLLCNGDGLSEDDYPELRAVLGIAWGSGLDRCAAGPGGCDFNLPDLRGRFLRGLSSPTELDGVEYLPVDPGVDARTSLYAGGNVGAAVGSYQQTATNRLTEVERLVDGPSNPSATVPEDGSWSSDVFSGDNVVDGATTTLRSLRFRSTGDETRPVNAAVTFIIKY